LLFGRLAYWRIGCGRQRRRRSCRRIIENIEKEEDMANTKSAKKAARQAVRRTEVNKSRKSRAHTAVRKVEEAISAGNKTAAAEALKSAAPILARNAQKGVLHKKTASRKVSRLSARVKAIAN
jgi:small subunit ribosomal protein S20